MKNIERARLVLMELARAGVREIVLCAGARNAPFVALLAEATGLRTYSFYEERAAGFFAIGRMQSEGLPVAVCTTSGTAVAELLPAVVEADYQGLPLVALSADRPVSYRGSGSPQTIVQPGIFSHYVEKSWDLEDNVSDFALVAGRRPVHVNICFDEPLIDEKVSPWEIENAAGATKTVPGHSFHSGSVNETSALAPNTSPRTSIGSQSVIGSAPIVIVGRLNNSDSVKVKQILLQWRRPVYLEALSHLRGSPDLSALEICGGEESLRSIDFDSVIRIGDVPTLRFWRDLEKNSLPVVHFSRQPWSGLPRHKEVFSLDTLSTLKNNFTPWQHGHAQYLTERTADQKRANILGDLLIEFPLSECAWIHRLSQWIPAGAKVFLGNSLPIREWDLVAKRGPQREFYGNRGTNGIDGLISTFIGVAGEQTPNWGIIGDLSALYDMSGPWALRQRPIQDINLVVINNGGGKIFERIFNNKLFENAHDLEFSGLAKLWNWNYQKISQLQDTPDQSGKKPRLFEITPDPKHTDAFNRSWEQNT